MPRRDELEMKGRGLAPQGRRPVQQGMPPGQMPGGPPMGPPMEDPMMGPMDDMPMEEDPEMLEEEMLLEEEAKEEEMLPKTATVEEVEGNKVVMVTDKGETIRVPKESFPVKPSEGMRMVRAQISEVTEEMTMAVVGEEEMVIELSKADLEDDFEVGDFFWMPEPPMDPEDIDREIEIEPPIEMDEELTGLF